MLTIINGEEYDMKPPPPPSSSSLLETSKSLLHSKYEILIKYTLVPSIPLSIIAILSINPNTWVASEIHHFYIELIAVILAAVLAFYYIARARTLNDKFSLFIGIGFLTRFKSRTSLAQLLRFCKQICFQGRKLLSMLWN